MSELSPEPYEAIEYPSHFDPDEYSDPEGFIRAIRRMPGYIGLGAALDFKIGGREDGATRFDQRKLMAQGIGITIVVAARRNGGIASFPVYLEATKPDFASMSPQTLSSDEGASLPDFHNNAVINRAARQLAFAYGSIRQEMEDNLRRVVMEELDILPGDAYIKEVLSYFLSTKRRDFSNDTSD